MELKKHNILIVGTSFHGLLMANLLNLYGINYTIISKKNNLKDSIVTLQPRTIGLLSKLGLREDIKPHCKKVSSYSFFYYGKLIKKTGFDIFLSTYETGTFFVKENKLTEILTKNIQHNMFLENIFIDYKNKGEEIITTIQNGKTKELRKCNKIIYSAGFNQTFFEKHSIKIEKYDRGYFGTEFIVESEKLLKSDDENEKTGIEKFEENINCLVFKKFCMFLVKIDENKYICKIISKRGTEKHKKYLNFALKKIGIGKYNTFVYKTSSRLTKKCTQFKNKNFFLTGNLVENDIDIFFQKENFGTLDIEKLAWMISLHKNFYENKGTGNDFEFWNIYSQEKKTDKKDFEKLESRFTPLLSDNFFISLFKEYFVNFYVKKTIENKEFLEYLSGIRQIYSSNNFNLSVYPDLKNILLQKTKDKISLKNFLKFANSPKLGTRSPSGYLVLHINEPKVYRRRLNDDEKFVLFFFIGIGNNLSDETKKEVMNIQKKYSDLVDCYIINNNYDIAKHDKNERILGDPGANFHNKYLADSPCIYLIRPDGIITWKSLGFFYKNLEKELQKISKSD